MGRAGDRPDNVPGLAVKKVYTSNVCDEVARNMQDAGYSIIQIDDYTVFYRMTDDYGIVEGVAVVEADGTVYFVAECGDSVLMLRP